MLWSAPERRATAEREAYVRCNLKAVASVVVVVNDIAGEIAPCRAPRVAAESERGGEPGGIAVRKVHPGEDALARSGGGRELLEEPRFSPSSGGMVTRLDIIGEPVGDA
ncbi:MAG: hypothetical protein WBP81_21730 [Solirubrobacteraceae bacterium]